MRRRSRWLSFLSVSLFLLGLLEWAVLAQLVHVMGDAGALAAQEILHRAREPRVGEPVRRGPLDRQQAAEDLVLALRAAFEHLQPAGDRILDSLVVAALEMQQRHMLERAPVAPVKGAL